MSDVEDNDSVYNYDYSFGDDLQSLADERNVLAVGVHTIERGQPTLFAGDVPAW